MRRFHAHKRRTQVAFLLLLLLSTVLLLSGNQKWPLSFSTGPACLSSTTTEDTLFEEGSRSSSTVPSADILCYQCRPPANNKSLVYRRPSVPDIEDDDTALRYNLSVLLEARYDDQPNFLICVSSLPERFERRTAIRLSWGRKSSRELRVVFFMCRPQDKDVLAKVQLENLMHKDIVMGDTNAGSKNGVFQAILTLAWVRLRYERVMFVLKIYDDTYVNTRLLLNEMETFRRSSGDIFGKPVMFSAENVRLQSCAYLLKGSSIVPLIKAMANVLLDFREDVYVTEALAKSAGLRVIGRHLFSPCSVTGTEWNSCLARSRVTVHPVSASRLPSFHDEVVGIAACQVAKDRTEGKL